jgi:hypothetical protein
MEITDMVLFATIGIIAMGLISVGNDVNLSKKIILNTPESNGPPIVDSPDNTISTVVRNKQEIMSLKLCKNEPTQDGDCDTGYRTDNSDIYAFWQVKDGVGCCSTFNCNYDLFYAYCLKDFKLYDIYFDDVKQIVDIDYNYTCVPKIPYNYWFFENMTEGQHTIRIDQKECKDEVVVSASIEIEVTKFENDYVILRRG